MTYDDQNIFAQIIRGDIDADKVYEDEDVLAIHDIAKAAPVHILVLPKGPYCSFDDFVAKETTERVAAFFATIRTIAHEAGLEEPGYRIITNHGADASQSVPHFHVHVVGGRPLGGLLPGDTAAR